MARAYYEQTFTSNNLEDGCNFSFNITSISDSQLRNITVLIRGYNTTNSQYVWFPFFYRDYNNLWGEYQYRTKMQLHVYRETTGIRVQMYSAIADGDAAFTAGRSNIDFSSATVKFIIEYEDSSISYVPAHEWDGTRLRFKNPDGTWGDYVDLKGDKGDDGQKGDKGDKGLKGDKGNDAYIGKYTKNISGYAINDTKLALAYGLAKE